METCEMSVIKYILFIFNLIFAISGLGIIIAGALVLADVDDISHFVSNDFIAPSVVLIVVGAIVFIIAFLGCFGAVRENYNLLIAFAVCLLIVFICELAVGIAAAVYKNDFSDALKTGLKKSINNYTKIDSAELSAWDKVQAKLGCCGVDGPDDWQGQKTPSTCCHANEELKQEYNQYCIDNARGKYLYKNGCYESLKMKLKDNSTVVIGVGIGISFIEIVGIALACWLAHSIKKERDAKA